ncbi:MAG: sigma-70 family RNA polymerase sigma factor [Pseudomonadota bacterium]
MSEGWLSARFAEIRPRALAALTRQFRDLDLAEEAFGDACLSALRRWPAHGQPDDPLAWLLTVARNRGIDRLRRARREGALRDDAGGPLAEEAEMTEIDPDALRDDVLRLLFVCCHPALSRQDQLALALKVVAGMRVAEVARAFLVTPRTMEQRITRAKRRIAEHPVPFETPEPVERLRRLREVSLMVYLMFNEGWSASSGDVQIKQPLCGEAIRLARLLLQLFPGMTEQMGLLALLLFQHARHAARVDADGDLVPIDRQDRALWDRALIAEAAFLTSKARRHGGQGAFQLQAEIAELQATAPSDAEVDWARMEALYGTLYLLQPTPVVRLNQAVAVGKARGAAAALPLLEEVAEALRGYRWFHTTRAGFLEELGEAEAARTAYDAALRLGPTDQERRAIEAARGAI